MTRPIEREPSESVVYRFATPYDPDADILYVNVVPRYSCTNSCRFCSRRDAILGKPNIYEQKAGVNLRLSKAPSIEGVMSALKVHLPFRPPEIAFVGLGEPLLQFNLVTGIIGRLRQEGYSGKIRVDTNGLVKCTPRLAARRLKEAGLDEIRISVNATSPKEYVSLCRPKAGLAAFERVCALVKDCLKNGIRTKASFVTGFEDRAVKSRLPEEYERFAVSLGVMPEDVIKRPHIPPISPQAGRPRKHAV